MSDFNGRAEQFAGRASYFTIALLRHPAPTKEDTELGRKPKSIEVLKPETILASSVGDAQIQAIKRIPEDLMDKTEEVEVIVNPC